MEATAAMTKAARHDGTSGAEAPRPEVLHREALHREAPHGGASHGEASQGEASQGDASLGEVPHRDAPFVEARHPAAPDPHGAPHAAPHAPPAPTAPCAVPATPPPLAEQAYRAIRSRIIACRYRPGSRLNEAEVAAQLGLGRTPVRQAFDRLRLEGLVTVHPRKGVEVRGFEVGELLEIAEARLANECLAAGLAAERATAADLAALEEILLRSGVATEPQETARLMQLDAEFHGRLADIAGNTVLAALLRNLCDRTIRFWFVAAGRQQHRRAVIEQHADIVAAIAAGDRAGAEDAMRRHLEDFRRSVMRQPGLERLSGTP
ncbi:GntR family transcriptional regulator [Roseomonas elaeocarpi]|uniref:GntR family transcriptional regulator n=1 Tax=Roseomonas elaeocarpi TaxID=907779 RepID=A0ABV6JWE8_9PROT